MKTMVFGDLPEGLKRATVAIAVVWWLGFWVLFSSDVSLWWTGLWTTPSTLCAEIFAAGDPRLSDCEYAAPGSWADNYLRQQSGKSTNFYHYQAKVTKYGLIKIWLFGPIIALMLVRLGYWVKAGFKQVD